MGFLSGPVTFQCFQIGGDETRQFVTEQVETLRKFAIGQIETASADQPAFGFLAGGHLFDVDFDLAKNVIGDALHCGMRIDVNQIPAAVRKAWLQLELAALTQDNPGGRPTKVQRQDAKEAVAARCEEEAKSGRFRRMQQVPLLWDALNGLLYCGGTSGTIGDLCCDLFAQAFGLELTRLTAGKRAQEWALQAKRRKALDETIPAAFHANNASAEIAWWNQQEGNFDFLGNEFLLWLWWYLETQSDTIALSDGSEVTGMFARTLSLQCPRDESGKESISAESPIRLPEAGLAIRSGKLPRKAGLTLVRHGEQYELALQAETFAVGGAKIIVEETDEGQGVREDRLESLRSLQETLTLLFHAFCERRIGKNWSADFEPMRRWLKSEVTKGGRAARA
jgi:hypothetical protein